MISEQEIVKRVGEIAAQISEEYKGESLVLVGVLRGSLPFLADLMRRIDTDMDIEIDFICVSSYGNGTESSGNVQITKDITTELSDKHLILVEDIVDSGRTLMSLKEKFEGKALSVKCASLLSKPSRRAVNVEADYTGFEIEDKFVVGYGMDCAQKYRNLPYIMEV